METLILYIVIPERTNFLQLGRYGKSCEQRFRQNFPKDFDWCGFNLSLSWRILTEHRKAIAINPSYISKLGKDTPWIGYFWSHASGQSKRGLEILGIGLVNIDNNDCISLEATGSMQSQARDVAKLSFNFNASLTTINRAKVLARERGIPFSMASCKSMIHNIYLLERLICVSGIRPNKRLNEKLIKEIIEFAAIIA